MYMKNSNSLILIVDDDPVNAQIIMKVVRNEGYNVKFAGSGEAALKLLDEQLFDLILLDVHMPEMNGYEVCHRIKKNKNTQINIFVYKETPKTNQEINKYSKLLFIKQ